MKILGFEINWRGKTKKLDKINVQPTKPSSKPASKIPKVNVRSLSYSQQFAGGRGNFVGGEYDLSEIGKVEDVESYMRQAFKKKEGLMFKEGVGVRGADKNTIKYYKTRMDQISRASGIPNITLLKRTARSLIRVSNAFLVKVRNPDASGGRIRVTPEGKEIKPVAAYFPAAPETMTVDMDENTGKIRSWQQVLPDGRYRRYAPEDVIHFAIDRREGFFFGVPTSIPVIDDIRALRQIEENIELLLYQNLFPLFHYKVGTETAPAGFTEDGDREVEVVEDQIKVMPSEGAIVTPERHEITAIGSEGRALRAEGYLDHFRKRVFAGLGVSEVDMGDGQTSNRATANVMSRALVDSVKAIQDDFEAQWNHEVISELLLESTFGDDVLEEDLMVYLQFAEIDIQNKMDQEQHAAEMFKANGLTYDEFRAALSMEPIPLPDDPEDQDLTKYPEWSQTYWKLIEEPLNLIRSVDEPYSAPAQAAAAARGSGITQQGLSKASEEKKAQEARTEKAKATQVVQKPTTKKDNFLSKAFKTLETATAERLISSIRHRGVIEDEYLMSLARVWAGDMIEKVNSEAMAAFINGFNLQTNYRAADSDLLLSLGRKQIKDRIHYYIEKLIIDTIKLIRRRIDDNLPNVTLSEAQDDILAQLHIAFDAIRYRTDYIWDTEIRKAYVFGRILGMRSLGQYGIKLIAASDACERCKAIDGIILIAQGANLDDIPPLHPNSRMEFEVLVDDPNRSNNG